jgi:hypothetical protein
VVPRITGPIPQLRPVEVRDFEFLRANADRRAALEHQPPERLVPAPDCGMKYLPRDLAFVKLKALAEGAAIVRRELTGV